MEPQSIRQKTFIKSYEFTNNLKKILEDTFDIIDKNKWLDDIRKIAEFNTFIE